MKSRVVLAGLFAALVGVSSVLQVSSVAATPVAPDWMNGEVRYEERPDITSGSTCVEERWHIDPILKRQYVDSTDSQTVCVFKTKNSVFGYYRRDFRYFWNTSWYTETETGFAIATAEGIEQKTMRIIHGFGETPGTIIFEVSKETDVFMYTMPIVNSRARAVRYFKDISDALIEDAGANYPSLTLDRSKENTIVGVNNVTVQVYGAGLSKNGEYISFITGDACVVYQISTGSMKALGYSMYFYSGKWPDSGYETKVSDNGRYVVLASTGGNFDIVQSDGRCAEDYNGIFDQDRQSRISPCRVRSMYDVNRAHTQQINGYYHNAWFDIAVDGGYLTFYDGQKWATIYAPNYIGSDSMDYLALGDSYTSGEGDIDTGGASHYLPGTNVLGSYNQGIPRELCHISERSYPFLLANDMGDSRGEKMQSIACSGAVRDDVYAYWKNDYIDTVNYLGQPVGRYDKTDGSISLPRLQGLNNRLSLQEKARTDFIPGRVQQIELLKKYHPKVATIGISGNDSGFGAVLADCVLGLPNQTCHYATPEGLSELGSILQGNYEKQVKLYKALKTASPGTDLYAVGYPQFIKDGKLLCWASPGLSSKEQEMIRQAVTYANETIKQAAFTVGIKYINIENSLDGGELCEGSQLITDPLEKFIHSTETHTLSNFEDSTVTDSKTPIQDYVLKMSNAAYRSSEESLSNNIVTAISIYMQEAFHPNAAAHQRIYSYIHTHQNGTSLLDDTCDGVVILCGNGGVVPAPPSFFGTYSSGKVEVGSFIGSISASGTFNLVGPGEPLTRGQQIHIRVDGATSMAGQKATIKVNPGGYTLGALTYNNEGVADTDIVIPSAMDVGNYVLSIMGEGLGTGVVTYMQPVFIIGPNNDIDGDGIENSVDTCEFLKPSGKDSDGDGIDDACDLSMSTASNEPKTIEEAIYSSINIGHNAPTLELLSKQNQEVYNNDNVPTVNDSKGTSLIHAPAFVSGPAKLPIVARGWGSVESSPVLGVVREALSLLWLSLLIVISALMILFILNRVRTIRK